MSNPKSNIFFIYITALVHVQFVIIKILLAYTPTQNGSHTFHILRLYYNCELKYKTLQLSLWKFIVLDFDQCSSLSVNTILFL